MIEFVHTHVCMCVPGGAGGVSASAPVSELQSGSCGGPQGLPHPARTAQGAAQTAAGDTARHLIGRGHSQASSRFAQGSW